MKAISTLALLAGAGLFACRGPEHDASPDTLAPSAKPEAGGHATPDIDGEHYSGEHAAGHAGDHGGDHAAAEKPEVRYYMIADT